MLSATASVPCLAVVSLVSTFRVQSVRKHSLVPGGGRGEGSDLIDCCLDAWVHRWMNRVIILFVDI